MSRKKEALRDPRGQLEQRCERWCVLLQRQQLPRECEHERRLPLRSCLFRLFPAGQGPAGAPRQKGHISRPTRPKIHARAARRWRPPGAAGKPRRLADPAMQVKGGREPAERRPPGNGRSKECHTRAIFLKSRKE